MRVCVRLQLCIYADGSTSKMRSFVAVALLLSHDSHTHALDSFSGYLDHSQSLSDAQIMSSDFSPTGSSSSKIDHPIHSVQNKDATSDANIRNFAPVARIMKTALPENAKIAKEAKECMQECVSEFISFITSEGRSTRALAFWTRTIANVTQRQKNVNRKNGRR